MEIMRHNKGGMMKIAFYFHDFKPFHQFKDPGLIPSSLKEKGFDVTMITLEKEDLKNYNPPFNLIQIKKPYEISKFKDFDAFIVYSWLDPRNTYFIELLKNLGKPVIVKADANGRIGAFKGPKERFENLIIRNPKWKIPLRLIKKFFIAGYAIDRLRLKQFELADFVVIESPEAAQNLSFFLSEYGRTDLIKKIWVIPDPVTDDIFNLEVNNKEKENIIVAVGRWEAVFQKNTKTLVRSLSKFLALKTAWKVKIIGSGEYILRSYISKLPSNIRDRISIVGVIPHDEIKQYMVRSRIFFMPSRFESFGIAAAEALCCGCAIVGTPIEPLKFLTMQGFSGNVASSFSINALVGTLIYEAEKHERGEFDCKGVSEFWKKKLNKNQIAVDYAKILLEIFER
jgi:glycosyltransferase involved in cell wall biosynthesis